MPSSLVLPGSPGTQTFNIPTPQPVVEKPRQPAPQQPQAPQVDESVFTPMQAPPVLLLPHSGGQKKTQAPVQQMSLKDRLRIRFQKRLPIQFAVKKVPVFKSYAAQIVRDKVPNNATPEQVMKTLIGSGVKPDEIKWNGIDDFLRDIDPIGPNKGRVNKDELLQYMKENGLKLKEKTYGLNPDDPAKIAQIRSELQRHQAALEDRGRTYHALDKQLAAVDAELDAEQEPHNPNPDIGKINDLRSRYNSLNRLIAENQKIYDQHESDVARTTDALKRAEQGSGTKTKYEQYTIPGGTNYKEMLLMKPEDDNVPSFKSNHWDIPNVLAHVRFNDRVGPNGEKLLNLEELQSDWAQTGREYGFQPSVLETEKAKSEMDKILKRKEELHKPYFDYVNSLGEKYGGFGDSFKITPEEKANAERIKSELNNNEELERLAQRQVELGKILSNTNKLPDMPFKKTWHEMALRRMLRYAAENGYQGLTVTPGIIQADRYNLANHVHGIRYEPQSGTLYAADGPYAPYRAARTGIDPSKLKDYIGHEATEKLLSQPKTESGYHELTGSNLRVGGQGMRGFYDQIVPTYLNKLGKKWGVSVGKTKINGTDEPVHYLPITEPMRQSLKTEPQAMFARIARDRLRMILQKRKPIRFADPTLLPYQAFGDRTLYESLLNAAEILQADERKDARLQDKLDQLLRDSIFYVRDQYPMPMTLKDEIGNLTREIEKLRFHRGGPVRMGDAPDEQDHDLGSQYNRGIAEISAHKWGHDHPTTQAMQSVNHYGIAMNAARGDTDVAHEALGRYSQMLMERKTTEPIANPSGYAKALMRGLVTAVKSGKTGSEIQRQNIERRYQQEPSYFHDLLMKHIEASPNGLGASEAMRKIRATSQQLREATEHLEQQGKIVIHRYPSTRGESERYYHPDLVPAILPGQEVASRKEQIRQMLANGIPQRTIAEHLKISPALVNYIKKKMNRGTPTRFVAPGSNGSLAQLHPTIAAKHRFKREPRMFRKGKPTRFSSSDEKPFITGMHDSIMKTGRIVGDFPNQPWLDNHYIGEVHSGFGDQPPRGDKTPILAFSDFMEEHGGKPTIADILRHVVNRREEPRSTTVGSDIPFQSPPLPMNQWHLGRFDPPVFTNRGNNPFSFMIRYRSLQPALDVSDYQTPRHYNPHDRVLSIYHGVHDPEVAERLIHGLLDETTSHESGGLDRVAHYLAQNGRPSVWNRIHPGRVVPEQMSRQPSMRIRFQRATQRLRRA